MRTFFTDMTSEILLEKEYDKDPAWKKRLIGPPGNITRA
jgi:hypothetical protein